MFEIYDASRQKFPIKVWLDQKDQIDEVCYQQSINLSNLPFLHQWVALMPDTHQGFGMPIGGVIALKDHVIPNAVGVDIGCGIAYCQTNILVDRLDETTRQKMIKSIMNRIPLGFSKREISVENSEIQAFIESHKDQLAPYKMLMEEMEKAKYQLGTLGSGNHFIEIQKDDKGFLGIMIHSGSRHFGYEVAQHFDEKASQYCKKIGEKKIQKQKLAYLPVDHPTGKAYLLWMTLAMKFAAENRRMMMTEIQAVFTENFEEVLFEETLNVHHNYAALENHYGDWVWVHRKGAIKAELGALGIIPGAMGTASYIVEGKGDLESFQSCSHGAGRHFSRKQALKIHSKEEVLEDLKALEVSLGTPAGALIADESRFAYKDISFVMSQQQDLVSILKELRTVLVVKG